MSTISGSLFINPVSSAVPSSTEDTFHALCQYISKLVSKGGPTLADYDDLNSALDLLAQARKSASVTQEQLQEILVAFGESLSRETIQGLGYLKPHGYAGDFEIIDKIYRNHLSPIPELQNWDRFVHYQPAFKAVKNRLSYFLEEMWDLKLAYPQGASVLNLASGPGRDMLESFRVIGNSKIHIDCVEQDATAIQYAQSLCGDYLERISFIHRNVCRFSPKKHYDLIWSGGLFDYFNEKLFKRMLTRFLGALKKNGKLVIGNFSENNPTQSYMDFFDWVLFHRSRETLGRLAIECGVSPKNFWIEQEPEGVNLFLHIVNA
ncbi:class I SAM-dependent methyltransferase [Nitrospira sp. M1]